MAALGKGAVTGQTALKMSFSYVKEFLTRHIGKVKWNQNVILWHGLTLRLRLMGSLNPLLENRNQDQNAKKTGLNISGGGTIRRDAPLPIATPQKEMKCLR
jgi:hypothetical protein